jgi:uracil phosphoribosyltransferase
MKNLHIIEHPLIDHKLSILRDKATPMHEFRRLLDDIGLLMTYEVTRSLETEPVEVETPVGRAVCNRLAKPPVLVTILRAGIGMLGSFMQMLPESPVGFLGMQRNEETLKPESYYSKIPSAARTHPVILIDPMLATGGSAGDAIAHLRSNGVEEIVFVCLVAAPEGVKALNRRYPDLHIYTAALDDRLNEHGYIVPGLGDAGDRVFGTGTDDIR